MNNNEPPMKSKTNRELGLWIVFFLFLALGTRCKFSRPWHLLQVFPRLAPVASFPALGTRCKFSCLWHPPFPAFGTGRLVRFKFKDYFYEIHLKSQPLR